MVDKAVGRARPPAGCRQSTSAARSGEAAGRLRFSVFNLTYVDKLAEMTGEEYLS